MLMNIYWNTHINILLTQDKDAQNLIHNTPTPKITNLTITYTYSTYSLDYIE